MLDVLARYEASGAIVEASGRLLRNTDLVRFCTQCKTLYQTLHGSAVLESYEPNLAVCLRGDGQGHIDVETKITPDHMTQRHRFQHAMDQTFLPGIMLAVERVLQRVPVRGDPANGG